MAPRTTTTQVGIVGGGPAGLMLSHLLARDGIESVVVDNRRSAEIEQTVRAGILERDSVRLLVETGVSDRVLREGDEHEGIELAFAGGGHRVDFADLVGASVWLYPQTTVFADSPRPGRPPAGTCGSASRDAAVADVTGEAPVIRFTDDGGAAQEVRCRYLVGADGSRSMCRHEIPPTHRRQFFREYPYAWFGIICQAPRSAPELIYNHSERGLRADQPAHRGDAADVLPVRSGRGRGRLVGRPHLVGAAGPGRRQRLHPAARARSWRRRCCASARFVNEPMRYGNLLLAGDAAHTVPPTGAKGLNLALADVKVLAEALVPVLRGRDPGALDAYTDRALARVWNARSTSRTG